MKVLRDILYRVPVNAVFGDTNIDVNKMHFDSREVSTNDVFVALKGVQVDGHDFIEKALDKGVLAIVCETVPEKRRTGITYVEVLDSSEALAIMSSNYYDNPSKKIKLVGVTGTNGKTTVTTLLYELFMNLGRRVGLLSTVKIMVNKREFKATHTTPDSLTINKYLAKMVAEGVEYCFMEVSSHGIHQNRTLGLNFAGGVFTNLSHDHLDYHASFAEYRDVKKRFFDQLPKDAFALTNIDDKNGPVMIQNTKTKKYTYALKTLGDFKAKILEKSFSGSLITINGTEVWSKLIGTFNAYNLLAIYGVADLMEVEKLEVLKGISELNSVSGRFQYIVSETNVTAIVDYAHTPDALKNVLETINDIRTGNENVITVVGCGGDRDKTKRPKMAHIASQLSNQAIFTSDNPRTEDPQAIINEMEKGVSPENYKKTISIVDRKQAIKTAYKLASPGDIILIAGKGHENYQEVNGERRHFDDLEEIKMCFN
ncbi:UDP-N-acetylmuramoylalanyl-D-glutamate--2,6-diaminopimelate ligase [Tenacibaculum skagerrakense]|uniref:UDP-N-acetylmuramoyl-L-alanyl-D-glutamate--2,6-diaminopimelate ligase n=1 Tax=Tenacibaculum skagerrakense TaxID=186571 RepID=A0A4R2NQL2_9FLAO|nr:UDP-N-acetylmuramoyl-L-alanyl-D-glutamate--2,6-diaminopimelate ligase [Tenacibaculum skagerrakense]TCP23668.1 UDP-N-acetylmuramoylalanyl-D-glutamate--2,6-diaminopimelate ligase [Tenacibaculum skagerrakense]